MNNNQSSKYSDYISLGLIRDLEMLAYQNHCILWIKDYVEDRQLFVSATYEAIFSESPLSLYQNTANWGKSLNVEDSENFCNELKQKRMLICSDYTALYSINKPDQTVQWIQDRSFHLPVKVSEGPVVAGCALPVPNKEVLSSQQDEISSKLDFLITEYYKILTREFILSNHHIKNSEEFNALSKREKQIFMWIIKGKTAAQIAEIIHLSPRTVESYLVNLKAKLNCDSKSDLIMKAINNSWLHINI